MTKPLAAPETPGLWLGIAVLSAAAVGVQILETRLFSVMLWHHLTYMVVTVTLLGFAASGSVLAVLPRLRRLGGEPRNAVSLCASSFGITLLAAFAWLAHTPLDTLDIEQDRTKYFWLFARYAYLVVPFLCAGMGVAIALVELRGRVHRVYCWNLVGSGAGSCIFVLTIRALGAIGCLGLFVALGGIAGLAAAARTRGAWTILARGLALATTLVGALGVVQPQLLAAWLPVKAARSKALTLLEALYDAQEAWYRRDPSYPPRDMTQRRTVWNPMCRIDTVPVPRDPALVARDRADPRLAPRSQVHVFQDGDAPTVIWSHGYAQEVDWHATLFGLAYALLQHPDVLVIGPGGGNEVATAVRAGARGVTAVEVNGDMLALLQGPFASYTGNLYGRPEVRAVHAEGRSYLRRQTTADGRPREFDLLAMSGTDTYAALASGSYIFSESYLYTAQAFDDFFAHLAQGGIIQVLRFCFEPPRETLKLVVTAAQALQRLGVNDPRRHFLVVQQEDHQLQEVYAALQPRAAQDPRLAAWMARLGEFVAQPRRYGIVLMRKRPFTPDDVAKIAAAMPALNRNPAVPHVLAYDAGAGLVPGSAQTAYGRALAALAAGEANDFFARYPFRIAPATDDCPFFFDFYAWRDLMKSRASTAGYAGLTGSEPIGRYVLAALLLQAGLLTIVLVLAPLLRLPRRSDASRTRLLVYFSSLGIAYLLVEIATIQRFVLYLGHPTYSLTANLAIFLVFSGLGAALAGRLGGGRGTAAIAGAGVVVLLAAHAVWLPEFLRATLAASDGTRVLYTCAWIVPLAACMGMPFPTGLRLVAGSAPELVPWAVGVNGAASVLASVLGIVMAMELGFTAVLLAAALLYALAVLALPRTHG